MPRCLCWSLLWLGLLLVRGSLGQSQVSRARKLCGRHLLQELVELCGTASWSQAAEEDTPLTRLLSQAMKVESFIPDRQESSQTTFPSWGRGANPVSISASQEEAINNLLMQSLPEYRSKKANMLLDETSEVSSSQDFDPYMHEVVEFQKKNKNKIKTLSSLFWGHHPQRKRRGYSEKCCLRGCTKEELLIACLPYINDKKLQTAEPSFVTRIL
ncbi:insulin-like peptide INSL6 [Erinaceus europaeus]|uniref:Insulin-like peptide INSL6 n=1 Tax=Erinaceus europaeus TaxID=9365 RepID=A0A1S3AMG8_ERIEU|nr:insulin-like peptide INSL6 [Erinaceus europaeus]